MSAAAAGRCSGCRRPWTGSLDRCGWCGTLRGPARCRRHPTAVASVACAVCGLPLCVACRHGGRHVALCDAHRQVRVIQGWAEVARAGDEVEAEVLASTLRAAELDAQLLSQKDHANVVGHGGLAVVRVLVPAFQYQEALEAAREARAADAGGRP